MLAEERRDFNLRKLYGKPLRRRSGRDRDRTVERRQQIMHTVNNLDSGRERFPVSFTNGFSKPIGQGRIELGSLVGFDLAEELC